MLDLTVDMRVEAATLAAEVRQLRTEHRRATKKARRYRLKQHDGAGVAGLKRDGIYFEMLDTKRTSRLHHLTRMMLKGKDYHVVEQLTYHRVNADALYEYAWQWWPGVTEEYVLEWLGQEAA